MRDAVGAHSGPDVVAPFWTLLSGDGKVDGLLSENASCLGSVVNHQIVVLENSGTWPGPLLESGGDGVKSRKGQEKRLHPSGRQRWS